MYHRPSPLLSENHKKLRMDFVIKSISTSKNDKFSYDFKSMENIVHLDEKWFFVDTVKKRFYHLDDEIPYRTCQSRRHIHKVMFLCAVCKPCDKGGQFYDGKIGLWPITKFHVAQRNTKNQRKGDLKEIPISVTKKVYANLLISKVIPAIKNYWPEKPGRVVIQHDNAKAHNVYDNEVLNRLLNEGGWDIRIIPQPPRSPDLNVLDLGFFNAIQSLQLKNMYQTTADLIQSVKTAFENLASAKLKSIFLVLQKVHEQIIIHYGGNNFKVPHLRNDRVLLANDDAYSTGMRATEIIDNFLNDNIQEDFDLLREQVVESEIEDGFSSSRSSAQDPIVSQ